VVPFAAHFSMKVCPHVEQQYSFCPADNGIGGLQTWPAGLVPHEQTRSSKPEALQVADSPSVQPQVPASWCGGSPQGVSGGVSTVHSAACSVVEERSAAGGVVEHAQSEAATTSGCTERIDQDGIEVIERTGFSLPR
jgi:hypothetical protein